MRTVTFTLLAAAMLVAAFGAASVAAQPSPYLMAADPLPANPAARPWRLVAISAGPLVLEADSSAWPFGAVASFGQALAAGDVAQAFKGVPTDQDEELRAAGGATFTLSALLAQLSYSPALVQASGTIPKALVELMKGEPLASLEAVQRTRLEAAAWSEVALRANAPIPLLPEWLGVSGVSAGLGFHALSGKAYLKARVEGDKLVLTRSERGSGTAWDAGVVVDVRPWLSFEAALVGLGSLRWEGLEGQTIEPGRKFEAHSWTPSGDTEVVPLPATAMVAAHLRPLPLRLLEVGVGYARVGVDRGADGFDRWSADVAMSLLGMLRAGVGIVQESHTPGLGVTASLGAGLGVVDLSLKAAHLEELARPGGPRRLGIGVVATAGF